MNDAVLERLMRFFDGLDSFAGVFRFETRFQNGLCASYLAANGGTVQSSELYACRDAAKRVLPFASMTRAILPAVCLYMAQSDAPEAAAQKVTEAYRSLRRYFGPTEYAAFGALCLAEGADAAEFEKFAANARTVYNAMKARHGMRTSTRDVPACVMLALRGADPEKAAEDADACFKLLRGEQRLRVRWCTAQASALDPREAAAKAPGIAALYRRLRTENRGFRDWYELCALAADEAGFTVCANDALAVYDLLRSEKKLNALHLDAAERLTLAYMLVRPSKELYVYASAGHLEKRAARAAAAAT